MCISDSPYTLSDTVGFVRALPPPLIEAFRSTLQEVAHAAVLLHVVDGSHPDPEGQIAAVREVLAEVIAAGADKAHLRGNGAEDADQDAIGRDAWSADPRDRAASRRGDPIRTGPREIIGINKADAAESEALDRPVRRERGARVVSARTGAGLAELGELSLIHL